jgi:hypothetical protein
MQTNKMQKTFEEKEVQPSTKFERKGGEIKPGKLTCASK